MYETFFRGFFFTPQPFFPMPFPACGGTLRYDTIGACPKNIRICPAQPASSCLPRRGCFPPVPNPITCPTAFRTAVSGGNSRSSVRGSGDILRQNAALQEENSLLRERVEYWRGQTRRTERVTTDKKAVERAARELIRAYNSSLETAEIAGDLQSLYDYIASGRDGSDELTYTEARRRSDAIARRLVDSAAVLEDDAYRDYADLRSYLRTGAHSKLTLEYHGINEFRRGGNRLDLPAHEANITEQTDHTINGLSLDFDLFSRDDHTRHLGIYSALQQTAPHPDLCPLRGVEGCVGEQVPHGLAEERRVAGDGDPRR